MNIRNTKIKCYEDHSEIEALLREAGVETSGMLNKKRHSVYINKYLRLTWLTSDDDKFFYDENSTEIKYCHGQLVPASTITYNDLTEGMRVLIYSHNELVRDYGMTEDKECIKTPRITINTGMVEYVQKHKELTISIVTRNYIRFEEIEYNWPIEVIKKVL